MLDDYDYQVVQKPELTKFGKEKSKGALESIIGSVYQSAFGQDIYPSIQEKAANLLYFIVKDHPFIDGCKRIAASIFLYFLNKNNLLFKNKEKIISDSTLVAITLLLAESKPEKIFTQEAKKPTEFKLCWL